tara:strand:- start:194 stop:328 length:135 start_codon:yes stop_codon:yes gene_type:complete
MDYKDKIDKFLTKYMYIFDVTYFMLAITGVYFLAGLATGVCTLK